MTDATYGAASSKYYYGHGPSGPPQPSRGSDDNVPLPRYRSYDQTPAPRPVAASSTDGHASSANGNSSIGISLEPEFKAISLLLTDITKFRIFDERDASAAIKISRALFQAFMKFKLNDKSQTQSPLENYEEEAILKRLLSFLIEVEEGKRPQINFNDQVKKLHKLVQVEPDLRSQYSETNAEDVFTRPQTKTLMDDIKFQTNKRSLDSFGALMGEPDRLERPEFTRRGRSRSVSPSDQNSIRTRRRDSRERDGYRYNEPMSRNDRIPRRQFSPSPNRQSRRSRSRSPHSRSMERDVRLASSNYQIDPATPLYEDKTVSVKIVNGCKVSRFIRTRQAGFPSRRGDVTDVLDMELDDESPRRRARLSPRGGESTSNSSRSDSFVMKVKPASTLSQAKSVAAVKAGLYTDISRHSGGRK